MKKVRVSDYLTKGKENAKTREELCNLTGLTDRLLRLSIEAERLDGTLILSSSRAKGYYLPKNVAEVQEFVVETRHRIHKLEAMKSPAEIYLIQKWTEG